jgi:hypothetical protein
MARKNRNKRLVRFSLVLEGDQLQVHAAWRMKIVLVQHIARWAMSIPSPSQHQ